MSIVRTAAIDCGTNSIRLLIADIDLAAARSWDVTRELRIVRLGEGVDATGAFAPGALERTFAACREYAALLQAAGDPPLRFVATSASRDVSNRAEFAGGIREILGVAPEVISGDEEAVLSFEGATRGLPAGTRPPYLVFDIGGGSTEFVLGTAEPTARVSVDVGCVRMTERHLHDDPPTPAQIEELTADVDAAIARAAAVVPLDRAATLVGLAGTVTTMAALMLGLPAYDSARIHHSRIPAGEVRRISELLLAATLAERLALPAMVAGREDVIAAGALILRRIVAAAGAREVLVSEHDILDGIAWSVARSEPTPVAAPQPAQPMLQDDPVATADPLAEDRRRGPGSNQCDGPGEREA